MCFDSSYFTNACSAMYFRMSWSINLSSCSNYTVNFLLGIFKVLHDTISKFTKNFLIMSILSTLQYQNSVDERIFCGNIGLIRKEKKQQVNQLRKSHDTLLEKYEKHTARFTMRKILFLSSYFSSFSSKRFLSSSQMAFGIFFAIFTSG